MQGVGAPVLLRALLRARNARHACVPAACSQWCKVSSNFGGDYSVPPLWLRRFAASSDEADIPLHTGRPRLLVLGTGWAAARLLRDIDPKRYDLTVISPRNHMVFTPLLASTTVGTIESRCVALHITSLQKALFDPQNRLYQATATTVHPEERMVECFSQDDVHFRVKYDILAIATGSQGSTFGIPGVEQNVHFLRDVKHGESIRNKLIENIGLAGIPGRSSAEVQRLLHVVIVGGGPTGVEVAGELSNFINRDLRKIYPNRARSARVTLIEAKDLLGNFDAYLREYAAVRLTRQGVELIKGAVKECSPQHLLLHDGRSIPYGLCIWSTGVGPTEFTLSLPFAKTSVGRLAVDGCLRVLRDPYSQTQLPSGADAPQKGAGDKQEEHKGPAGHLQPVPDVYAMGDCCANVDNPLPALAQVAEQQGKYLAKVLNAKARNLAAAPPEKFVYKHLGSMATVGGTNAVLELGTPQKHVPLSGFFSWVAWRSAYLTRLGSIRNKLYVMFNWTMTLLFGRDMSRW